MLRKSEAMTRLDEENALLAGKATDRVARSKKNILFVSHVASQLRHFIGLFETLSARGHAITIMAEHKSPKPQRVPDYLRHVQGIRMAPIVMAEGVWGKHSRAIRATRNYFLYYEDEFKNATVFRERCYNWVDTNLRRRMPADSRPDPSFEEWLADVEDSIPPSQAIQSFLRQGGFDVVLLSPYIFYQNTFQFDYAKCCHHLGIPVGFPVFSWDNLTSKGSVQIMPDRIWVWNDIQKRELVRLHKVPGERVGVVGAWRFDTFAQMSPTRSRAEFCQAYGFDPARPLIAYLGSSPAIAPNEGEFVAGWLDQLRSQSDERLAGASVLVRSHPRNLEAWKATDGITRHAHVAFQEPDSANLFEGQGLYDLLYHSHAAIGLNTSAMLEAAILRKPVHTIKTKQTANGHEGTVHFAYLNEAGGGLLYTAEGFDEHFAMLAPCLARGHGEPDLKAVSFARAFIDAGGAGPVASVAALADEVEQLAELVKQPVRQSLRQRLRGRYLAAQIRLGLLMLEPDPDYVGPIKGAAVRSTTRLIATFATLLDRVDDSETIKAYLLSVISRSYGLERAGPKSLQQLGRVRRWIGSSLVSGCVAALRFGNAVGYRAFLRERIGLPASIYRPDLIEHFGRPKSKSIIQQADAETGHSGGRHQSAKT